MRFLLLTLVGLLFGLLALPSAHAELRSANIAKRPSNAKLKLDLGISRPLRVKTQISIVSEDERKENIKRMHEESSVSSVSESQVRPRFKPQCGEGECSSFGLSRNSAKALEAGR